ISIRLRAIASDWPRSSAPIRDEAVPVTPNRAQARSYDIQVVFARGARLITAAVQGKQRSVKQADNNRAQHVHAFTPRDATHRTVGARLRAMKLSR
ncbi:hypothetical protein VDQ50_20660, partial [Xanthomonas campestris pv. campestris]|uniref:hypothetical protein n=1 Tax=Xanthomonas campestris TaxID=339 RepID=UPI002AD59C7C